VGTKNKWSPDSISCQGFLFRVEWSGTSVDLDQNPILTLLFCFNPAGKCWRIYLKLQTETILNYPYHFSTSLYPPTS
jgi:hypothetical protein